MTIGKAWAAAMAAAFWMAGETEAAFRFFDPADSLAVPKTLSASGFYSDIRQRKVTAEAVEFDVNAALWSDGSIKQRWVLLKPGTHIVYVDTGDRYEYPPEAVFVKQFSLDTVPGDPKSRILWETRLLVRKVDVNEPDPLLGEQWFGFSYRWNAEQSDAFLVPDTGEIAYEGLHATVRVWPKGTWGPPRLKKWTFPSRGQCRDCHVGRKVLGFFTAQLNRPLPSNPAVSQLKQLFDKGVFRAMSPLPDFGKSARWYRYSDSSSSLDLRARSYLGANCSGCHGERGNRESRASQCGMNFDFYGMKPFKEFKWDDLSWDYGIEGSALIFPSKPEKSAILVRMTARDTVNGSFTNPREQMPPKGTYEVDTVGVKLISDWIASMPAEKDPRENTGVIRPPWGTASRAPVLVDGYLRLPSAWLEKAGSQLLMAGLGGKTYRLRSIRPGEYRIPDGTPPGVYVFQAGPWRFLRRL